MIVEIKTDQDKNIFEVEHHFEPGKITYQDPTHQATVVVYFRLNEVLIKRDGEITSQEPFILNQSTMGFYRQNGITFKTIIKTKHLIINHQNIHIEYEHEIEGVKTDKTLDFRLFI